MKDLGLFILRLTTGLLMAGHGGQKLFGWFKGPDIEGTMGMMESMGLKPGRPWAFLAGLSEFGGGMLTVLGFLNPLGSLGTIGAMLMATTKVHWGKPIWNTRGGAELPVTNIAISLALGLLGPGKLSLDNALHIKLPRRLVLMPGLALTAAAVAASVVMSNQAQKAQPQQATQSQEQPAQAVPVPERPAVERAPRGDEQPTQESEYVPRAELPYPPSLFKQEAPRQIGASCLTIEEV